MPQQRWFRVQRRKVDGLRVPPSGGLRGERVEGVEGSAVAGLRRL